MKILFRTLSILFIINILCIVLMTLLSSNSGGVIAATSRDKRLTNQDVTLIDTRTGITLSLLDNFSDDSVMGRTPVWSHNGEYVSFWMFPNRQDRFAYEFDLNEPQLRNLTESQNYASLPVYGADNQRLFTTFLNFNNAAFHLISDTSSLDNPIINGVNGVPVWSPDGRYIAYLAIEEQGDADETIDAGTGNVLPDILVIDVQTGDISNYTAGTNTIGAPVWSPDGSQIIFVSRQFNFGQIYIITIDTGEMTEIPIRTRAIDRPTWSPDARYLAFTSNQQDENSEFDIEVVILDMETYELQNISHSPLYDTQPAWSPDSRQLAFVSRRLGTQDEIYIANVQTGTLRRLTYTENLDESDISWRPR